MSSVHLAGLLFLSANLWAADPFLGSWKLNLAKSKFEPGPAPREIVMTCAFDPAGVKVTTTGTAADGRRVQQSYIATYGGKEYSRSGPWNLDAVINRQVSERAREDIFKKNGRTAGMSKLVVSPNGKILTVTWNYGELRDVRVYDRQE